MKKKIKRSEVKSQRSEKYNNQSIKNWVTLPEIVEMSTQEEKPEVAIKIKPKKGCAGYAIIKSHADHESLKDIVGYEGFSGQ